MEKVMERVRKRFANFPAGDCLLDDAPWSGRPGAVDSNQTETLTENHQCYTTAGDSRHTPNIPINKVIGENERCVFYFTEKTKWTFWQPNTRLRSVVCRISNLTGVLTVVILTL